MKVKNLTIKPLGFGKTIILPDQTSTLPDGYDKDHPTVKYFFSRKWLKEISVAAAEKPVDPNAGNDNDDGENDDLDEHEDDDADTTYNPAGVHPTDPPEQKAKAVSRMNLEELKAYAAQLGLAFAETDTRNVLIDKINAAIKGKE